MFYVKGLTGVTNMKNIKLCPHCWSDQFDQAKPSDQELIRLTEMVRLVYIDWHFLRYIPKVSEKHLLAVEWAKHLLEAIKKQLGWWHLIWHDCLEICIGLDTRSFYICTWPFLLPFECGTIPSWTDMIAAWNFFRLTWPPHNGT